MCLAIESAVSPSYQRHCHHQQQQPQQVQSPHADNSTNIPSLFWINIDTLDQPKLDDRAFPVAAARASNALLTSASTASSYIAFMRQTLLSEASFDDDRT